MAAAPEKSSSARAKPSAGPRNKATPTAKRAGRYHGLFIGIDEYASLRIPELKCAERDARALHALFGDTLGDNGHLLCGRDATQAAIADRFAELRGSAEGDVVVVTFSGHGSDLHHLLPHDADPADLDSTAIPLDLVLDWFKGIPARRLICVLDCCFSGGLGAKVLSADERPRAIRSADAILEEISGDGRLILTASAPDEEAWESQQTGHGLLTHYLLEALQGADEVRRGGKVSVLRLLEFVATRVADEARHFGHPQHPTLRGTLDAALAWPVFKPGPRYKAAFPVQAQTRVTPQVESLAGRFRPEVLTAWAGEISELNVLQVDAINECGVLDGENLVVSAPTSSGKTMVGELAALSSVERGGRALFLLPMKALVNDKQREFERKYAPAGVRTIRATGDYSDEIPALLMGRYEICLMTYEKCAGLALAMPHILDQVGTVVIDEVQILADESRGTNLEFLMTLLRARRRRGTAPQAVALSAVVGNTNGLERWLGGNLLRREERPVPLDEGVLQPDGSFRFVTAEGEERHAPWIDREYRGRSPRQELIVPLVRRLVAGGEQVIVFREKRGETMGTADYLAADLGLPAASEAIAALPPADPSDSSDRLRRVLSAGVAFHNSDLSRDEREVIEREFLRPDSPLRVIVATTTLAMGINTGASSVVIAGLDHPSRPPRPYSVAEYKNMVGRAGRLGFADRGTSYIIAASPADAERLWRRYVLGEPEALESRFLDASTDPRSLILRVLAAGPGLGEGLGAGMRADDIVAFLEESFGVFRRRESAEGWRWSAGDLERAIQELDRHALIEGGGGERYRLTDLGRLAGESGHAVDSVLRLVAAMRPLSAEALSDATIYTLAQLTAELDQVWLPTHPKSPKEPQPWFGELQLQRVPHSVLHQMRVSAPDGRAATLRAKRAVACLLWTSDYRLREIEAILTRHVRESAAAGQLAQVVSRTGDLLPLVTGIAQVLHPEKDFATRTGVLLTRLEIGVPADLDELTQLAGDALTRADYLALRRAGIRSVDDVVAADDDHLASVLNGAMLKVLRLREAALSPRPVVQALDTSGPLLPPP
jgi:replicative superfamily II helicase